MASSLCTSSKLVPQKLTDEPPAWLLEVMSFLTFGERASLVSINRSWSHLQNWPGWWQAQCSFAAQNFNLYCPKTLPASETWRTYFEDLWSVRGLWQGHGLQEGALRTRDLQEGQRVQVFARIRPMSKATNPESINTNCENAGSDDAQNNIEHEENLFEKDSSSKVTLPLHQRVALIKLQFPDREITSREALKILQRQGDWFNGMPQTTEEKTGDGLDDVAEGTFDEDLAAAAGAKQSFEFKIHNVNEMDGSIVMTCPNVGIRSFNFNGIFGEDKSQGAVYDRIGRKLVADCLNGWNGTLFVYGQTGSGKTYTMYYGPDNEVKSDLKSPRMGLVPRACAGVLQAARERNARGKVQANVSLSYIEVYNEQVFDLLRDGQAVARSAVAAQRFVLSGQAQVQVHTQEDIEHLLRQGETSKTKAATLMNERSTRGHTLIILTLRQRCQRTGAEIESHLFLGDLGGSERLDKSKAEGQNKVEAQHINMGLLALKRVIAALNRQQRHVPYKESKLTMLMSAGLGGSSRTRAVVCINSDPTHAAETLETLRFGEECSLVKNQRRDNNASFVGDLVREINFRIKSLEDTIREKERWETTEIRRSDAHVEEGTFEETLNLQGGEMIRTTRLVGAEAEHEQLQLLHERRRQLLGITV